MIDEERVLAQVRTWIASHRITEAWARLVHTTTSWIRSAAPSTATVDQRTLACLDLGSCFFLLDDCTGDEALARYDDLEHVASGGSPRDHRPLQAAFASLFERLARHGSAGSLAHYLALRIEFARALRRREQLRAGAATIDLAGYLSLREITIYFAPWLSTWELLEACELTTRERALVAPAFVPANRWHVLVNERVSIPRDRAAGTPNVIAMLADARGISIEAATAEIGSWADADLDAYTAAVQALRSAPRSAPVNAYLRLLEAGVDGALHYQGADPARYR